MNKNDQKWPYVAYPTTWTCTFVLSTDPHFWHDSRLHTRRQCCNFGVLKYWNEERYTSREKKCHSCVEFLFFHFWKSGQKYIGFTGCNRWVSQMFQWTIVFGTIWDCTYDDNFATFEWMIRRNKKVRGSNVKVAQLTFEEVFFSKEKFGEYYFGKNRFLANNVGTPQSIVLYLKRIHLQTFLARFEIAYTTTMLQRLMGWLVELRKLHVLVEKMSQLCISGWHFPNIRHYMWLQICYSLKLTLQNINITPFGCVPAVFR